MDQTEFVKLLPRCSTCGNLFAVGEAMASEIVRHHPRWGPSQASVQHDHHTDCRPDLKPHHVTIHDTYWRPT